MLILVLNMNSEIFKHSLHSGSLQKLAGFRIAVLDLERTLISSDRTDKGGDTGGDIEAGVPVDLARSLSSSIKVKRIKL